MPAHLPPAQPHSRSRATRPATAASFAAVLPVLIVALALTGGICVLVVAATPDEGRPYVGWSAGVFAVGLSVALAALADRRRGEQRVGARVSELEAQVMRLKADAARLAEETVPSIVKRLRDGATAEVALAELPPTVDGAHYKVVRTLAEEVGRRERMRAAAMSACANAAGRVQALATSMLADLREMEGRHDEAVLGDLLKLDHSTAQAGRLADSIAVLTGARSGRRWTKPIVMESILRGAVGRISAYQRVRVHSTSNEAIAGYAAEGIMHALAELMDNATNFSPPTEEVHVYVEDTQNGVIITIEDGGLVMGPAALDRAEQAVSADTLDLTTLSGTRLGLAVVGSLARKHGLTVSFRPSSRGGTGVVVMLPRQLVAQPRQTPVRATVGANRAGTGSVAATPPSPSLGTSSTGSTGSTGSADEIPPRYSRSPLDGSTGDGSTGDESYRDGPFADREAAASASDQDDGYLVERAGFGSGSTTLPFDGSPPTGPVPPGSGAAPPDGDPGLLDVRDSSAERPIPPLYLPKRRRGETLAAAPRAESPVEPRARTRADAGSRFGAFRDASRRRATGNSGPSRNPDTTPTSAAADRDGAADRPATARPEDEGRTR